MFRIHLKTIISHIALVIYIILFVGQPSGSFWIMVVFLFYLTGLQVSSAMLKLDEEYGISDPSRLGRINRLTALGLMLILGAATLYFLIYCIDMLYKIGFIGLCFMPIMWFIGGVLGFICPLTLRTSFLPAKW